MKKFSWTTVFLFILAGTDLVGTTMLALAGKLPFHYFAASAFIVFALVMFVVRAVIGVKEDIDDPTSFLRVVGASVGVNALFSAYSLWVGNSDRFLHNILTVVIGCIFLATFVYYDVQRYKEERQNA
ncbi:hypothetical protein LD13_gp083 [Bacillus phage Bobb]|uniref:Uncharacterized protein n=1 Tax=Bacillus phage Bobb TaxID=1527469 RepID=A0A076G7Q2_9CAUD|nr:hypothetical protein LD13_gp083 [Bacillus phage Bobb]AII27984.1 hypothetical protein [Bacillus phage Bobb]